MTSKVLDQWVPKGERGKEEEGKRGDQEREEKLTRGSFWP